MTSALSHAELKLRLLYDPENGVFTWRANGKKQVAGQRAGCMKPHGYEMIGLGYRRYYAHRLAWLYIHGEWPREQIDHINGDRADNRISNLRIATRAENQRNRGRQRNNQSGVAGVHWAAREQQWIAKIKVNGRTRQIGVFVNLDAAALARRSAEIKFFGQFNRAGESK